MTGFEQIAPRSNLIFDVTAPKAFGLEKSAKLTAAMQEIAQEGPITERAMYYRLLATGLIARGPGALQ